MSRVDFDSHVKDARKAMALNQDFAARICAQWAGLVAARDFPDIDCPFTAEEPLLVENYDRGRGISTPSSHATNQLGAARPSRLGMSHAAHSVPRETEEE